MPMLPRVETRRCADGGGEVQVAGGSVLGGAKHCRGRVLNHRAIYRCDGRTVDVIRYKGTRKVWPPQACGANSEGRWGAKGGHPSG